MKNILLKHANIYFGDEKGTLLKDNDILIEEGKIKDIGKNIKIESNTKVIDATNKFITPGLINMHAHLPGSGKNFKSNDSAKKLVGLIIKHKSLHFIGRLLSKSAAKRELLSGVTTVRAVGGVEHFDSETKAYINKHPKKGARLFVSDYAITVPGGHMTGTVSKEISTPSEGIAMVKDLANHNVDLIKVMITGGCLDATKKGAPGELKMPLELVKPIVEEAHRQGLKVASHTESVIGVKTALEAGVDSIEHGCKLTDELEKLYKKHKSINVVTISPACPGGIIPIDGFSELVTYNCKYLLKDMVIGAREEIKRGMRVGLGNDVGCPYITHDGFWREPEFFHRFVGVSREFALYTATQVNAEILGQGDKLGSLAKGKIADLILLNNDPMKGFDTFKQPFMVIKEGYLIKKTKQKKVPIIEQKMDEALEADFDKVTKDIK